MEALSKGSKKFSINQLFIRLNQTKEVFEVMKKNYQNDSQVYCNNFALGNIIEEKNLNITSFSGKSSFFKINSNPEWSQNRVLLHR